MIMSSATLLLGGVWCPPILSHIQFPFRTVTPPPNCTHLHDSLNPPIFLPSPANPSFSFNGAVLLEVEPLRLGIGFLGPFLSAFGFLFILRIVMSWYPKLPVGEFPYVIAYAPTEPFLVQTRKIIRPLGGVDVTPVVWFGIISFLNEILVGPQGLLLLLLSQAQQQQQPPPL